MPFEFRPLSIPDVVEIVPRVFGDERGGFAEMYQEGDFREQGIEATFKQFNYSRSTKGVLRGLHYQLAPQAQGKLLTAISGEVFDVAVDLRKNSPTFGKWVNLTLSAQKKNLIWVPVGFAHGFCVTSAMAEVMYYVTDLYSPELERGIIWNDPALGVTWPAAAPILSEKDKVYPTLAGAEYNFEV